MVYWIEQAREQVSPSYPAPAGKYLPQFVHRAKLAAHVSLQKNSRGADEGSIYLPQVLQRV
jgi:hypothetical protein